MQWTPELLAIFSKKAKADEPYTCMHTKAPYDSKKLNDPSFPQSYAECDNMYCRLMRYFCRVLSV